MLPGDAWQLLECSHASSLSSFQLESFPPSRKERAAVGSQSESLERPMTSIQKDMSDPRLQDARLLFALGREHADGENGRKNSFVKILNSFAVC
jgi:hypothetical protein